MNESCNVCWQPNKTFTYSNSSTHLYIVNNDLQHKCDIFISFANNLLQLHVTVKYLNGE